jgi:squalene synthase HpnC
MKMCPSAVTSVDHYENFPVASWLVPAPLRPAIAAIYRFARYADDVADEGNAAPSQRLAELDRLAFALRDPHTSEAVVTALHPHLLAHQLPIKPFEALLSAFRQDVTTLRYPDHAALADYCHRSAEPVGELVLRLVDAWRADTREPSGQICSALQLITFLQDLAIDWRRGRLYLPLDELHAAGLDVDVLDEAARSGRASPALRQLIAEQAGRARWLLDSGAALIPLVPTRLAWELRAIVAGGFRVLDRLAAGSHDPFAERPTLGWRDGPALVRLWWRTKR